VRVYVCACVCVMTTCPRSGAETSQMEVLSICGDFLTFSSKEFFGLNCNAALLRKEENVRLSLTEGAQLVSFYLILMYAHMYVSCSFVNARLLAHVRNM